MTNGVSSIMKIKLYKEGREYRTDRGTSARDSAESVICVRATEKLGWPQARVIEIQVSDTEEPGFTKAVFIDYGDGLADSYSLETCGRLFCDLYSFALDFCIRNPTFYYNVVEVA